MKNLILTLISILFAVSFMMGQAVPQAFNYQGIASDANDAPVSSATIGLQIELLQGSSTGTVVYTETHTPMTNANGIFSVQIGKGTTSDDFSSLDWLANPHFVRISIDTQGGTAYVTMNAVELLSVPYAQAAKQAETLRGFSISGTPNTGDVLVWDGAEWKPNALSQNGNFVDLTSDQTVLGAKNFDNINASTYKINNSVELTASSTSIILGDNSSVLGNDNIFIGNRVGISATSDSRDNVSIGNKAGENLSSGTKNVFLGAEAGEANAVGGENTFLGCDTGEDNTFGDRNVFVGYRAGNANTTGNDNILIGAQAGVSNIDGDDNVFIGEFAGSANTYGESNVYVGSGAGNDNQTGDYNTFIGYRAGYENTGSRNVFVGPFVGRSETGSNKLYISNSDDTSPLIYGDFSDDVITINGALNIGDPQFPVIAEGSLSIGNGLVVEGSALLLSDLTVNGFAAKPGGGSWSSTSDRRLKDVGPNYQNGLSEINKINPVHYNYKKDNALNLPSDQAYIGIIAQELQKAIPEAVSEDDKGYLQVNNDPVIWALVNATKELSSKVDRLEAKNAALTSSQNSISQQYESLVYGLAVALLIVLLAGAWLSAKVFQARTKSAFA